MVKSLVYQEDFKRFKNRELSEVNRLNFSETAETLEILPEVSFSRTIWVQNVRTLTVFVKNTGASAIKAYLQNSPNGSDFVDDKQLLELGEGELGYLVPYIFSKYIRLAVIGCGHGKARVWFQMQLF